MCYHNGAWKYNFTWQYWRMFWVWEPQILWKLCSRIGRRIRNVNSYCIVWSKKRNAILPVLEKANVLTPLHLVHFRSCKQYDIDDELTCLINVFSISSTSYGILHWTHRQVGLKLVHKSQSPLFKTIPFSTILRLTNQIWITAEINVAVIIAIAANNLQKTLIRTKDTWLAILPRPICTTGMDRSTAPRPQIR